MNYATKIKTAMASVLCVMVGMAFAGTTVTNDVQTYGATFEASEAADNDFAYEAGQKIANYTNELGTAGWFAGSEDDESVISNRTAAVEGLGSQYLLLNTDAETLTNKLSSSVKAGVNTAMAADPDAYIVDAAKYNGDVATYEAAVFESDVKFVASDTLDAGIPGGQDATKFAIYAYCNEDADPVTTNLVVFHAVLDGENTLFTNEIFDVDIDTTEFTHLRVEMKTIENLNSVEPVNVFSVTVNGTTLPSDTASEVLFEGKNEGIWFFTTEESSAANRTVSSLNFKGTGEIDNIKVSQKVKETYAAIVSGTKYASWETATNVAMNTANVLTSYESGKTLFLQAEDFISIANVQPVATNTVAGYKVETIAGDGFLTYTSKLDKATVIFLSDTGVELFRDDFQIGEPAVYGGTTPSKTADASGVYTWTGWTSGGVDYGTSDTLADVGVGGATYTATFSSVASQASVNGTYYATLADAISAATGTEYPVVLNDDVALSSTIIITDDVTIDLNGHDIAATGCRAIWVKSGNVLITGEGDVTAEGPGLGATSSVIRVGDGAANANIAALTVNTNVTVASATCYGVTVFGKNNDGNNATTDITFDLYGTVEVSAPYVAHGCDAAISGNGNSGNSAVDITIHDGAVVTSDNANGIYFPSAGTLAIEGGTIAGATAVYAKAGNIDISGGTLVATGTKAAYAATGDGANPTGDAIVIDNCGYPSGLSLDVAVTGGDVSSAYGDPIGSFATGSGHEPKDGFVSGGTFDAPLADDLCANGFIPVTEPNGEGKYEVTPGGTVTFKNGDVVLFTTNVVNGGTAVYEGATPVKPADASGVYTFDGWDPAIVAVDSADQTYTATFSKSGDPKATVISIADGSRTYYPDLASAIAAAVAGDTVKMLADCNTGIGINAGTNIVLDLGGYTLSNPSDCPIWPMSGTLVVSNGTIRTVLTGSDYAAVYVSGGNLTLGDELVVDATVQNPSGGQGGFGVTVAKGGTVTVDGATINAREMCVFVASRGGATVNVVDGTLTSTDNAVVGGYGTTGWGGNTINVSGGTLNASIVSAGYAACGIYAPNDDTVNISGGTINVTNGAGVVARAGSVNITGGTITTTGNTVGKVGDSRVVVPCAAVVFDSAANYPGNSDETATVEISGGVLQSEVTTVQVVADEGDASAVTIPTDSTALFSDSEAEGVPEGYDLVEVQPGLYGIVQVWTVAYVNYDGTELQSTVVTNNAATPAYVGETPVKPADASGVYTFTGFAPAADASVTSNTTYTAQFTSTAAKATVISVADGSQTYYGDLAAAVAAANSGDTVKLLDDVALTARVEPNLGSGTSLTIDLGGYTITRTGTSGNGSAFDVKSGNVVITNGVIDCTQDDAAIVADGVYAITSRSGSTVTLADLTITVDSQAGACVYPFAGSHITIESGTYANITEQPYQYHPGWQGMAVNQANVADKLLTINGGSFSQMDPQIGDDSTTGTDAASADFTDAGFVAIDDGNGHFVVQEGYNVTFDANGGTPAPEAQRVVAGGTATAPADPSKADGAFAGWTLDGNAYDFDTVLDADITLVATYEGYVAQIVGGASYTSLQAALDSVKENNLQQANIELLANASITISRNGNVLGGNSTTNITINGNNHELHVVRDGTWAQFNTANDATLVLNDVSLTSEFTGTQTGWVGDTLQNPNHNIAFNCDVELNDVTSTTALSFWKDADLDTVTIAETVDVYSIWIHTTASNIAIKDLVVNSPTGRGIKLDDSFVAGWGGTPSASTTISVNGAAFTTKNKKSAILVRSAYPIAVTTAGTIDISGVPADTTHLVWVDEDASTNFGLVTLDGAQADLVPEPIIGGYAATLSTNGTWIAGYYKTLEPAVAVADADDTLTLQKTVDETFTVAKELTITLNGFTAENVTAGEGYTRTVTETTYVFAEAATGFIAGDDVDGRITQDQADWLNAFIDAGTYTKAQLEGLTGWQSKYLLNVDPFTGSGTLTVTGITVGGQVKVTVTLARTEGGTAVGTREINGVLELWGTTGLGSSTPFAKLAAATISDADFSEGNTQEITFEGSAKFFKAYIVEPPAAVEP